ncbi:MAG TPA: serine hydrolase domain-containing protein [Acidimicrobiales bacterium]|nr:serine hydrolase domain-containing protein [Acidimicrobiales bacterium]
MDWARQGADYLEALRARGLRTPTIDSWVETTLDELAPSLQLAVFQKEALVLSIAAGHSRRDGQIRRSSLFLLYSSTKLYTALAFYLLHDRAYFDWDDPVCLHWPEFAEGGKEAVTIRHVLTHQAGIAVEPPATSWTWWGDRAEVARAMERSTLKWKPGEANGYHNRTYGFILDCLAHRLTGRGVDQLLQDELCGPAGVGDFTLGIGRAAYDSRFVRTEFLGGPEGAQPVEQGEFRVAIDGENMFNAFPIVRLPLAWGTAVATAEAAAALACFHAGKGRFGSIRAYSEETYAQATTNHSQAGAVDRTLGRPVSWGLGVQVDPFPGVPGLEEALAHGGGSTVQVWTEPRTGLSVAIILGGLRLDRAAARRGDGALGGAWQQRFAAAVADDFQLG